MCPPCRYCVSNQLLIPSNLKLCTNCTCSPLYLSVGYRWGCKVRTTNIFYLSAFTVSPLLWQNASNATSKHCIPSISYEKITMSSAYKSNKITCCISFGASNLYSLATLFTTSSNLSMPKPKSVGDNGHSCVSSYYLKSILRNHSLFLVGI